MSEPPSPQNAPRDPERELLHFLRWWFWLWPLFGALAITWRLLDPSAFQQCPQCLFVFPTIGAGGAGWTVVRTLDRQYVPQFLVSIVVLCIGAAMFWEAH